MFEIPNILFVVMENLTVNNTVRQSVQGQTIRDDVLYMWKLHFRILISKPLSRNFIPMVRKMRFRVLNSSRA